MQDLNAPTVLVAIAASILVGATFLLRSRGRWVAISILAFFALIGVAMDYRGFVKYQWLNPIQSGRSWVLIAASFAGLLIVGTIGRSGPIPCRRGTSLLWVLIPCMYALVRYIHFGVVDGTQSLVLAAVVGFFVRSAATRLTYEEGGVEWLAKAIILAAQAFLIACAVQWVQFREPMFEGPARRFVGVTSNPQFVGVFSAMALLAGTWLWRSRTPMGKIALAATMGAMLMALFFTGSRTSMLMAAIGLGIISFRRLGNLVFLAPLLLGGIWAVQYVADLFGVGPGLERLTEGGNTRTYVWAIMWDDFLNNPAFGRGATEKGQGSENSYLFAAASYGIAGAGLLVVGAARAFILAFRPRIPSASINTLRSREFLVAFIMMSLAGSVLEGFLVGRVNVVFFVLLATIAALECLDAVNEETFAAEAAEAGEAAEVSA
ncbi:MAG: O-antigen ligase family protein [Planctomycetota bacterium]|nr:O-antigen ligase family protein [Planctomycetota bacterium]